MDVQKSLSVVTTILLKLGVIVFLFPVFWELWNNPPSNDEFWYGFIKVASLIIYIGISILLLALIRIRFYYFGFGLVMLISVYQIADLAFKYDFHANQALYFLLIMASIYFLTKKERKQKRRF